MRKVVSKEVTAGGRFDLFLDSELWFLNIRSITVFIAMGKLKG